jgi:hypothetical protein
LQRSLHAQDIPIGYSSHVHGDGIMNDDSRLGKNRARRELQGAGAKGTAKAGCSFHAFTSHSAITSATSSPMLD